MLLANPDSATLVEAPMYCRFRGQLNSKMLGAQVSSFLAEDSIEDNVQCTQAQITSLDWHTLSDIEQSLRQVKREVRGRFTG
jgi:hypothetical protein